MLTYTVLFIASLIVAAVVYFIFRVITDSSRSVYSAKGRTDIIGSTKANFNDTSGITGLAYKPTPFGQGGHASPKHVARTNPAMPTGTINWGWQGSGVQLREPQLRPLKDADNYNHCSLYDVNRSETRLQAGQHDGRLRREVKARPAVQTAKVTRKEANETFEPEILNKPWGW